MPLPDDIRLVLVTPEKTLLDETVLALRFPLEDGQFGVLPGRAPMVGRLGYGPLTVTTTGGEQRYFIDGGFVQIKGNVVSLLTERSLRADEIDVDEATAQLEAARGRGAATDQERRTRDREQLRARRLLAMATKH